MQPNLIHSDGALQRQRFLRNLLAEPSQKKKPVGEFKSVPEPHIENKPSYINIMETKISVLLYKNIFQLLCHWQPALAKSLWMTMDGF